MNDQRQRQYAPYINGPQDRPKPRPRPQVNESRLLSTTDAAVWTDEFMKVVDAGVPIDWGLMIGWFANALETGKREYERDDDID